MTKQFLLILSFFSIQAFAQTEVKALFIGNSYTGYNNLTSIISNIAEENGNVLISQAYTPGGSTLMQHSTNPTVSGLINSEDWDYVILQEQSQKPSFPPSQVAAEVYPFAADLCEAIRDNNKCTKPVFFMTWGRENGDQSNCGFYPPLCTYQGMQDRLAESYTEMAIDNQALLGPVGLAWANVRENHPDIDLYVSDESHPSYAGSYLAANVLYQRLFGDTINATYYPVQLSEVDADTLTHYAQNIFTTTTTNFTTLVEAQASYEILDDSIAFYDESQFAIESNWQGVSQNILDYSDTLYVDIAGYEGTYEIILTATDGCLSDEYHIQIHDLDIKDFEQKIELFPNPSTGALSWNMSEQPNSLTIFSPAGKQIESIELGIRSSIDLSHLKSGSYILVFNTENKGFKSVVWQKKN